MASIFAVAPPSFILCGNKTLLRNPRQIPSPKVAGRKRLAIFTAKASGDGSESSSNSIVKYVEKAWNSSEDRIALAGLGFAAIVAAWASTNLVAAIDKLPLVPSALEFIGILFSWWFIYRYLLFKPDREELLRNMKNSLSDIFSQ
ncbi:protein CURVATURE THYLAKOID 1C, chloroplastic [Typha angustifolia]|uniref:protein CURVATURE THYLAKOID 1C, chloroplastic n=1 Tax=Typha angustifolia TaxID=59011 RepID=UPI003C2B6FD5